MSTAPESIGPYRVVGEIGSGGMGTVYRAEDAVIGREVAVKVIRLFGFADAEELAWLRDRLFREARAAGSLSHPGIVTVYQVGDEDGRAYIAMEYVHGRSLEQLMASAGRPSRDLVASVIRQTAAALDHAHARGVVHRDIKPANVLIADPGVVKITDFGIAKISAAQRNTQTGVVVGTPHYMSPEQVQGKAVDGRSDQFSLAVVAYEMLTGGRPFVAETLTSLCFKIAFEEPAAPDQVDPSIPAAAAGVLRKALAKDPLARYACCSDFARDLSSALAGIPMPRGNAATRRRQAAGAGAAVLFVALAIGAAAQFRSRAPRPAPVGAAPPAVTAHVAPAAGGMRPPVATASARGTSALIARPSRPMPARCGALTWTGELADGQLLVIEGGRASSGELHGVLPGVPVRVAAYAAQRSAGAVEAFMDRTAARLPGGVAAVYDPRHALDLLVWEAPGAQNGWKRLVLRCAGQRVRAAVIAWEISR